VGDALNDIAAERKRQIEVEGWTPEHDDEHSGGEMGMAAACYADPSPSKWGAGGVPIAWPWKSNWWKPRDRRRDLVRAGALIVAEIERLDRAEAAKADAA